MTTALMGAVGIDSEEKGGGYGGGGSALSHIASETGTSSALANVAHDLEGGLSKPTLMSVAEEGGTSKTLMDVANSSGFNSGFGTSGLGQAIPYSASFNRPVGQIQGSAYTHSEFHLLSGNEEGSSGKYAFEFEGRIHFFWVQKAVDRSTGTVLTNLKGKRLLRHLQLHCGFVVEARSMRLESGKENANVVMLERIAERCMPISLAGDESPFAGMESISPTFVERIVFYLNSGIVHLTYRFSGKIAQHFNLSRFPFDRHAVALQLRTRDDPKAGTTFDPLCDGIGLRLSLAPSETVKNGYLEMLHDSGNKLATPISFSMSPAAAAVWSPGPLVRRGVSVADFSRANFNHPVFLLPIERHSQAFAFRFLAPLFVFTASSVASFALSPTALTERLLVVLACGISVALINNSGRKSGALSSPQRTTVDSLMLFAWTIFAIEIAAHVAMHFGEPADRSTDTTIAALLGAIILLVPLAFGVMFITGSIRNSWATIVKGVSSSKKHNFKAMLHSRANRVAPAPYLQWKPSNYNSNVTKWGHESKHAGTSGWRSDLEQNVKPSSPLAAIAKDRFSNDPKIKRTLKYTGFLNSGENKKQNVHLLTIEMMSNGTIRGSYSDAQRKTHRITRGTWSSDRTAKFVVDAVFEWKGRFSTDYYDFVGSWEHLERDGKAFRGKFSFAKEGAGILKKSNSGTLMDVAKDVGYSTAETSTFRVGDRVEARFGGKEIWYAGKVVKVHLGGSYDIVYNDGDKETNVKSGLVRATTQKKQTPKSASSLMEIASSDSPFAVGDRVEARYGGKSQFYSGRISAANSDGSFDVEYDDGDSETRVKSGLIRTLQVNKSPKAGGLSGLAAVANEESGSSLLAASSSLGGIAEESSPSGGGGGLGGLMAVAHEEGY